MRKFKKNKNLKIIDKLILYSEKVDFIRSIKINLPPQIILKRELLAIVRIQCV
jgi:hypothetical protein